MKNILRFCNVSKRNCGAIPPREITYYDLTFVLKGQITYTADGETLVLNKDDAILLPPGTLRARDYGDKPVKYVSFNFTLLPDVSLPLEKFIPRCISEEVKKLMCVFPNRRLSPYYNAKQKLSNVLNYILFEILEASRSNTNNVYTQRIIQYIECNITKKMSLQSISREIGITREYAATLFKRETGQTVTEYINQRKMLLAKDLLLHDERSLSELATYLGYDSYNYFSRLFKRYFQISPRELKSRK